MYTTLLNVSKNQMATKRSQNKCRECKYTWYPKGKNLSLKCPGCGGTDVGYAGMGMFGQLGLGALVIGGFMLFSGGEKSVSPPRGDEKTPSGVSTSTPPVPANLMTPPAPSNREVQRAPNLTLGPVEYRNSAAGVVVQPGITMSQVPMPTSSSTGRSIRVYSLEEITSMEQAKGYQGNDLIVRRRLGLPSRETGQLIP